MMNMRNYINKNYLMVKFVHLKFIKKMNFKLDFITFYIKNLKNMLNILLKVIN